MNAKKIVFVLPNLLIGLVFLINIQAGFSFYFQPQRYTFAYELNGIPGYTAVAGTGLLFLMWNVPYVFAMLNPSRHKISLIQAIIMQTIGVLGESLLFVRIPKNQFLLLQQSIWRFIVFDSAGLILLILAFVLANSLNKKAQV